MKNKKELPTLLLESRETGSVDARNFVQYAITTTAEAPYGFRVFRVRSAPSDMDRLGHLLIDRFGFEHIKVTPDTYVRPIKKVSLTLKYAELAFPVIMYEDEMVSLRDHASTWDFCIGRKFGFVSRKQWVQRELFKGGRYIGPKEFNSTLVVPENTRSLAGLEKVMVLDLSESVIFGPCEQEVIHTNSLVYTGSTMINGPLHLKKPGSQVTNREIVLRDYDGSSIPLHSFNRYVAPLHKLDLVGLLNVLSMDPELALKGCRNYERHPLQEVRMKYITYLLGRT